MPSGNTTMASSQTPVSLTSNGQLPAVAGDAATTQSLGAVILDGYSRAYVLTSPRRLAARRPTPLAQALHNNIRATSAQAGPLSIAMTVRERQGLADGFELERTGIGPEDLRRSKLIAGSAVARVDNKTAVAFGFAEGAKAMERRLNGMRRRFLPDRQGCRRRHRLSARRAAAAWPFATNLAARA